MKAASRIGLGLLACAISCAAFALPRQGFVDPAPPKVAALADVAEPKAGPREGLKFYAAPKPLAKGAVTSDWRGYLGPTHSPVSAESPLLRELGLKGPKLVWEATKGEGYATPAVVGERDLLFHRVADNEVLECLEAETGKRFWKHSTPTTYRDRYGFNGGPRCAPISDGQLVFTCGVTGQITCLKLTTGQVVWTRNILKDFKLEQSFFGVGSTPLLEGNLLIVNVGASGGPCVAAFDKRTGKMAWGAGKEWGASYAAPISATVHGKRRLFVFAGGESRPPSGGLLCIDPANGKVDFTLPWRGRRFESVNASSPLVVGSQVYISECYGKGGVLLDLLPDGSSRQVWTNNLLGTHFMTAIHKDGYLYGLDGHGPRNAPLVCLDMKTGKEMWRHEPEWEETIPTEQGKRKVSLGQGLAGMVLVDGRCLMLGEYGHLVWLDLNPKGYKELDRATLFLAGETWGVPPISRGLLYVCQNSQGVDGSKPRLLCYDLRGAAVKVSTRASQPRSPRRTVANPRG